MKVRKLFFSEIKGTHEICFFSMTIEWKIFVAHALDTRGPHCQVNWISSCAFIQNAPVDFAYCRARIFESLLTRICRHYFILIKL